MLDLANHTSTIAVFISKQGFGKNAIKKMGARHCFRLLLWLLGRWTADQWQTGWFSRNWMRVHAVCWVGHSPDAFVQMAYQLAYSREHGGKSAPTYEACSTAGAFHGRTETIRSCSPESAALVAACLKGTATPELLSQATTAQSVLSRSAAYGERIHRHLLGLSKFAKV